MSRVFHGILAILILHSVVGAETIEADPSDYTDKVKLLQPGDTLLLAPGDYTRGLNLRLYGEPDAWITIKGPDSGPQPRFLGFENRCCNTIEIREGAYVALENLVVDGRDIDGVFGISCTGTGTHHIRVEGCTIVGHGAHQQTVGISTKATTWGWIVRRNKIVGAGTGIYFGNSTGSSPFIGGLIESNLFLDAKGYNMQVKHQNSRDAGIEGIPTTPQTTIIRHNVFIKGSLPNEDGARPNLLVGAYPSSGLGSDDRYEIYGNVFYHNHRESLLQAEGRVSIHDNIFLDCTGTAIYLVDHKKALLEAYVYHNTFYDVARAVRFADPARVDHLVVGNLMFSDSGVSGDVTNVFDNIHDSIANAANYVRNPSLTWGEMDFYPVAGRCEGPAIDLSSLSGDVDFDRDFNGDPKGDVTFRGAYAGDGDNPGWQLTDEIKGEVPTGGGGGGGGGGPPSDVTPPTGSIELARGAALTTSLRVDLDLSASDASGVAMMSFSNDGSDWSPPEPYRATREDWDLSAYGGTPDPGLKVVYVRFQDEAGNWSSLLITDSIEYQAAGAGDPPPTGGGGAFDLWTVLGLAGIEVLRRRRRRRR